MNRINRVTQNWMLNEIGKGYPGFVDALSGRFAQYETIDVEVNLAYLAEHKLIEIKRNKGRVSARLTAAGVDFLRPDGGVSEILKTVTVKFDPASVRELMIQRVESSDGDGKKKSKILATLRSLRGEALKELTKKAVDGGWQSAPNVVTFLSGLIAG